MKDPRRQIRGRTPAHGAANPLPEWPGRATLLLALGLMTGCPKPAPESPGDAATHRGEIVTHSAAGTAPVDSRASPEGLVPPEITTDSLDPALAEQLRVARERVVANPASAEAWGRFGQALHAAEFVREARSGYRRAAELDPTSAAWSHLLGLTELADALEEGLAHLRRAAERGGTNQDASRLRLAQALIERGRFPEATNALEALLQIRPDHPAAQLELGRVRLAEGQLAEAGRRLAPCLTNPFTAQPAARLLSQVRAREGQAEAAAALARQAQTLPKPFDWPDPYLREVQALRSDRARLAEKIGQLLAQRRFAEATTLLEELQQRQPNDPELLLLSGRAHLQQRQCTEAEKRFRQHLETAGDTLNGLIQLGLSLLCQERWSEAAEILERAVALKPDFAQAHANLALARSRQGDSAGAIRSYRDALRCNPGEAGTHAALAEELGRAGDLTEARRHLARALELDPANARARNLQTRWR